MYIPWNRTLQKNYFTSESNKNTTDLFLKQVSECAVLFFHLHNRDMNKCQVLYFSSHFCKTVSGNRTKHIVLKICLDMNDQRGKTPYFFFHNKLPVKKSPYYPNHFWQIIIYLALQNPFQFFQPCNRLQ